MSEIVSIVAAVLGGFILLFGLTSLVIKERIYISEACRSFFSLICKYQYLIPCVLAVAIACGIIFGPLCANFINVSEWGEEPTITKEFARIVIAIQVMAAGVALPKKYLYKELKSIAMLIGPVMICMWLVSGLLVWGLIPGLQFVSK